MVVKVQPTYATRRTMVRTWGSPNARTPVLVTCFKIPLLVRALVWHTDGLSSREVTAGNIVGRFA